MAGHKLKEPSNREARRLYLRATHLAPSALATSTKSNQGHDWGRFQTYCESKGLDPMEASGPDIATWLVFRSEQTTSPNMVEVDLNTVKCFRKHAGKPISKIPLVTAVKRVF